MADQLSIEELADDMYKLVEEYAGKRKLKSQELVKEMIQKHGISKAEGKQAISLLIDSGRCVYTYFGGSFVELPPKE
jgi:hypothetical protein